MFRRRKPGWAKLASGLFVPPYLKFAEWYPCCTGESPRYCFNCQSGTVPDQWSVVISGITDDGCGSCSGLNGTFVLDPLEPWDGGFCFYRYVIDPTICGIERVQLYTKTVGGDVEFWVHLWPSGSARANWKKTFSGSPVDCVKTGEVMSNFYSDGTWDCDASSSTATITAIGP